MTDNIILQATIENKVILVDAINNFNSCTRPRKEKNKKIPFSNHSKCEPPRGGQWVNKAFETRIFPMTYTQFSFRNNPGTKLMPESPNKSNKSTSSTRPNTRSSTEERGIKILPPKQILQRLPTLFPQEQSKNTSKNHLNDIRKIVYLLHWTKLI